ncbi:SCF ubiquitin ligase complex subunit cdc4 [Phlyctochytrium bullatum]|nr:SCF ubiquitin ligase complex subunit cdc4 [Phlyctochytrium bullatum]
MGVQFSLIPKSVTTQTIVTTTTTKITEFPPLVINPPAIPKHLDPSQFPLANTPTPPALKRFCFDLNGTPTRFKECEDLESYNDQPVSLDPQVNASHMRKHHEAVAIGKELVGASDLPRGPYRKRPRGSDAGPLAKEDDVFSDEAASHAVTSANASTTTTTTSTAFNGAIPGTQAPSQGDFPMTPVGRLPLPSVPLTPFPEATQVVHTVVTTVNPSPATYPSINWPPPTSGVSTPAPVPQGTANMPLDEEETAHPRNLPSPTMSPTATSLVPNVPPGGAGPSFVDPVDSSSHSLFRHSRTLSPSLSRLTPDPMNAGEDAAIEALRRMGSLAVLDGNQNLAGGVGSTGLPTLADLPKMISSFDSLPNPLQSYVLLQLLKRCPASTLQFITSLILPTLKRDFVGLLPVELSFQILEYLDLRSLGRCSGVCKRWHRVIDGEGAETAIWKKRLVREGWYSEDEVQEEIERRQRLERATSTSGLKRRASVSSNTSSSFGDRRHRPDFFHKPFGFDIEEEYELPLSVVADADAVEASLTKTPIGVLGKGGANQSLASSTTSLASASSTTSMPKAPSAVLRNRDIALPSSAKFPITFSKIAATTASAWVSGQQAQAEAAASAADAPKGEKGEKQEGEVLPKLFKRLYRRHHVMQQNWIHGRCKTVAFPGHGTNVVTCLQFDNDKIVSGSDDTTIHIYDTNTGQLRRKLQGHDGGVWALQYWKNSLVSGSTDRTVRVWDMESGRCTHLFEGHTSTVRCLMIVPPVASLNSTPSGSGSGKGGASPRKARATTGAGAGDTSRSSATTMTASSSNASISAATPAVPVDKNGDPIVPLIVTGSRDATLRVWRLPEQGTSTHESDGAPFNGSQYFLHVLSGHTNSVRAIAGHGRVLVSGSYDTTVRLWDLVTGEAIHCFRGHREKVYSVGYCHELQRAVSGSMDATVKVWCTRTCTPLFNLEGHTSLVGLLELSPKYLVSAAADASLRIWSPTTGQCLATLTGHQAAITCFHHEPGLNRLVSGSDGGVKVWELSSAGINGQISLQNLGGGGGGSGSGPGFAFTQGPNGPQPVYGRFVRDLVSQIRGVWRVRMDERRLVCALQRENERTWFEVLDFGEGVEAGVRVEGPGDGGWGPGNNGGGDDGGGNGGDGDGGDAPHDGGAGGDDEDGDEPMDADMDGDGDGDIEIDGDNDNQPYVLSPANGSAYLLHVLRGHAGAVRAIAGHGRVLVSGSFDTTVRLWDLVTGEEVHCFRGHREKVYSVAYCQELQHAVSGSMDATVKNERTWFEVLDFGEGVEAGVRVEGPGDGGLVSSGVDEGGGNGGTSTGRVQEDLEGPGPKRARTC